MSYKTKFLAIAAVSADGKIAATKTQASDWTSTEDKLFLRKILNSCDLIVVGHSTYKISKKPLSQRKCLVLSKKNKKSKNDNMKFINPERFNLRKYSKENKLKNIAILGGEQTYSVALEKGWIDYLYITIEPVVFGTGLNLLNLKKILEKPQNLRLLSMKKFNKRGTVLLKYKLL